MGNSAASAGADIIYVKDRSAIILHKEVMGKRFGFPMLAEIVVGHGDDYGRGLRGQGSCGQKDKAEAHEHDATESK